MKLSPREPVDIVTQLRAASTYPHNRDDTCTLLIYAAREIERLRSVFDAGVTLAKSGSCPCHCECPDCCRLWRAVEAAGRE